MRRVFLILTAALLLTACPALADTWTGSVTALDTVEFTAPATGLLTRLELEVGQEVTEGTEAGEIRAEKVFSPVSGTVAAIHKELGDKVSGTVLEINPTSRYSVSCTVSGTAKTAENALIHSGETLYIRCTVDGTHRAVGVVTTVDGANFQVEVTGGELYVGEAVYLYRDKAFSKNQLVGKGTVLTHATVAVSGEGYLNLLRVRVGDPVARGQWLFTTASSEETVLRVPASGIVQTLLAAEGETVQEDSTVAVITTSCALRIDVSADDAPRFTAGSTWYYTRGDDAHETHLPAKVLRVLMKEEDASATVELRPEDGGSLPLGMSVIVTDEPGI